MTRVVGLMTTENNDSNIWAKEMEMQKLYGMTQKEAHIYVMNETSGLSLREMAEMEGKSESTVRTLLARARQKATEKADLAEAQKYLTFVIPLLPGSDRGRGYKIPVIMKVCNFLADVYNTKFYAGESCYMIRLPAEPIGNVDWYLNNIAAKISNLVGSTDGPNVCEEVGKKMADMVREVGAIDKIGWGILKYHLDQMYVKRDVFSD